MIRPVLKHKPKVIIKPKPPSSKCSIMVTGNYTNGVGRAAKIAVKTVNNFLESGIFIKKVVFVLFSDSDYDVYASALDALK